MPASSVEVAHILQHAHVLKLPGCSLAGEVLLHLHIVLLPNYSSPGALPEIQPGQDLLSSCVC